MMRDVMDLGYRNDEKATASSLATDRAIIRMLARVEGTQLSIGGVRNPLCLFYGGLSRRGSSFSVWFFFHDQYVSYFAK